MFQLGLVGVESKAEPDEGKVDDVDSAVAVHLPPSIAH